MFFNYTFETRKKLRLQAFRRRAYGFPEVGQQSGMCLYKRPRCNVLQLLRNSMSVLVSTLLCSQISFSAGLKYEKRAASEEEEACQAELKSIFRC